MNIASRLLCGCVLAELLCVPAAAQSDNLVGSWGATFNPGTPARLFVMLQFAANGQLHERIENPQGQTFDVFGTYRFDPGSGTLAYTLTDYTPKQICSVIGQCQPAPTPPVTFNAPLTAQITFQASTALIFRSPDGTSFIAVRTG